jgi:hypothetical protein
MKIEPFALESSLSRAKPTKDIFSAFREIDQATGRLVTSSANVLTAFQRAIKADENYYPSIPHPKIINLMAGFIAWQVKSKNPTCRLSIGPAILLTK